MVNVKATREMTGKNELKLCKAEMIAAVQYYLDRVILSRRQKVRVVDVKVEKNEYNNSFVVEVEGVDE